MPSKADSFFFFFFKLWVYLFILFIYLWLCWVFVSVRGLSLVAASGGHSSLQCAGLSLSRPLLLRSTGSRHAGSVAVAHGPSCSAACGIFPDQGSNPCPLHCRQILNHCTTRETLTHSFLSSDRASFCDGLGKGFVSDSRSFSPLYSGLRADERDKYCVRQGKEVMDF